jgi:putative transposase
MARKRWHTAAEIVAELAKADALAAQGRTQPKIAQILGISVMTLHRWRKAHHMPSTIMPPAARPVTAADNSSEAEQAKRIEELRLENDRLRKLVTDLLLGRLTLDDRILTAPALQQPPARKLGA